MITYEEIKTRWNPFVDGYIAHNLRQAEQRAATQRKTITPSQRKEITEEATERTKFLYELLNAKIPDSGSPSPVTTIVEKRLNIEKTRAAARGIVYDENFALEDLAAGLRDATRYIDRNFKGEDRFFPQFVSQQLSIQFTALPSRNDPIYEKGFAPLSRGHGETIEKLKDETYKTYNQFLKTSEAHILSEALRGSCERIVYHALNTIQAHRPDIKRSLDEKALIGFLEHGFYDILRTFSPEPESAFRYYLNLYLAKNVLAGDISIDQFGKKGGKDAAALEKIRIVSLNTLAGAGSDTDLLGNQTTLRPESAALLEEARAALGDAVDELDKQERHSIHHRYFNSECPSMQTIAKGMPVNTKKKHVGQEGVTVLTERNIHRRALTRMEEHLLRTDVVPEDFSPSR